MRKEKVAVEAEFKAKGMGGLKAKWLDFAGELVEPVVLLAAGATKVEAAWAGMRGVFLTKVLGPLGLVAGAATAGMKYVHMNVFYVRQDIGWWIGFGEGQGGEISIVEEIWSRSETLRGRPAARHRSHFAGGDSIGSPRPSKSGSCGRLITS